jgi:hypothetical protein
MEIGRKVISEEEFLKLWSDLYQELYNLSTTNSCDATTVYNIIYVVCTSNCNLEEKLYWKIGDFLVNKCKIHRNRILRASNQDDTQEIEEYVSTFEEYSELIFKLNSIGSFLNNCVKGRQLNDFGFLLWERLIIQNLKNNFFENVFHYGGKNKLKILKGLENIKPDNISPLGYYKEMYEKVALKRLKSKYKVSHIRNFEEFCKNIKNNVEIEKKDMKNSFLKESYEFVYETLEESFYQAKYHEIVYNLIEMMDKVCIFSKQDQSYSSGKQINFNSFIYQALSDAQIENLKISFENEIHEQKALIAIKELLNSKTSVNKTRNPYNMTRNNILSIVLDSFSSLDEGYRLIKKAYAIYVNSIVKNNIKMLEGSINEIIKLFLSLNLFDSFEFFDILTKIFKDYLLRIKPCYMVRLCKFTENILSEKSVVKDIGEIEEMDAIPNGDTMRDANEMPQSPLDNLKPFSSIYRQTSDSHNRANPIAHNSPHGAQFNTRDQAISFNNPQDQINKCNSIKDTTDSAKLLRTAIYIVPDKNEFINLYQGVLKERLLNMSENLIFNHSDQMISSIISKEISILSILNIPLESRLYKMVNEIDPFENNFRLLNSLYWSIEPQTPHLPLPLELLIEMNKKRSEMRYYDNDGTYLSNPIDLLSKNSLSNNSMKDLIYIKTKLNLAGSESKNLKLAHQYSKVKIGIFTKELMLNIYQYVLICLLYEESLFFNEIVKKLEISEKFINHQIDSLLSNNIIMLKTGIFSLDYFNLKFNVKSGDYSKVDQTVESDREICYESYFQGLGSKILKKRKRIEARDLIEEIKQISKIEESKMKDQMIEQAIKRLIEKGVVELRGTWLEFVN